MIKVDLQRQIEVTPTEQGDFALMIIDKNTQEIIARYPKFDGTKTIKESWYRDLIFAVGDNVTKGEPKTFSIPKPNVLMVEIHSPALGDQIAFIPIIDLFQKKMDCKVIVRCSHYSLFEKVYSNLKFMDIYFHEDNVKNPETVVTEGIYITGYPVDGYNKTDGTKIIPIDARTLSLQEVACVQLGIEKQVVRPHLEQDTKPLIKDKYICITTCGAGAFKYWHYEDGWQILTDYYYNLGYEVVHVGDTPFKLENTIRKTGKLDFDELINYIQHAEFFIGLPSGLSWLAYSTAQTVYTIDGITADNAYFPCTKIQNKDVCNGCFNDTEYVYDGSTMYCPRNKEFECTKSITPEQVIKTIGI